MIKLVFAAVGILIIFSTGLIEMLLVLIVHSYNLVQNGTMPALLE